MIKLPSIPKIKKALYADWALRVKRRDGFECLLCGATENLTAHHWYVCDHNAHAARYSVDNGATLCYACHIRGIHTRADYVSVRRIFGLMIGSKANLCVLQDLSKTELTTAVYRNLWDAMRERVIDLYPEQIGHKGGKVFVWTKGPQEAVAGNVVRFELSGASYVVSVVAKIESADMYRYTLKRLEEAK
ncbi:MAG: hypothetical protein WCS18_12795 [Sphaerochaetaceae bacterium]